MDYQLSSDLHDFQVIYSVICLIVLHAVILLPVLGLLIHVSQTMLPEVPELSRLWA
jgi:hypothetical protein